MRLTLTDEQHLDGSKELFDSLDLDVDTFDALVSTLTVYGAENMTEPLERCRRRTCRVLGHEGERGTLAPRHPATAATERRAPSPGHVGTDRTNTHWRRSIDRRDPGVDARLAAGPQRRALGTATIPAIRRRPPRECASSAARRAHGARSLRRMHGSAGNACESLQRWFPKGIFATGARAGRPSACGAGEVLPAEFVMHADEIHGACLLRSVPDWDKRQRAPRQAMIADFLRAASPSPATHIGREVAHVTSRWDLCKR